MLLVFHDAAWANATTDPEKDSPEDIEAAAGHGIYSQLGHIVMVANKKVLSGEGGETSILGWKSHACARVCRSTFAAEVMSALEGWEDAISIRAMISGAYFPGQDGVSEARSRELLPVVSLTDCKSVYDNVHRVAGPRAPTEKRLVIDIAALRHMVGAEGFQWGSSLPGGRALRWLPTGSQLADALTKVKTDVRSWWSSVNFLKLPLL